MKYEQNDGPKFKRIKLDTYIQVNQFIDIQIRQRNVASQHKPTVPRYISFTIFALFLSKVWRSVDQWYLRCPGDTSRCLARVYEVQVGLTVHLQLIRVVAVRREYG